MGIEKKELITIFWFRRDLRIQDNAGLYHALKNNDKVLPLFIFDTDILNNLEDKTDARVTFIHQQIVALSRELSGHKSSLLVKTGKPVQIFQQLLQDFSVKQVITNGDYEPYAIERDNKVASLLQKENVLFQSFKDHVIFEKDEILGTGHLPYKVYTPFKNKWLSTVNPFYYRSYPTDQYLSKLHKVKPFAVPSLNDIGFIVSDIPIPSAKLIKDQLKTYDQTRNFPSKDSTSRLGVHLRFGTISVREVARVGAELNETWLSELVWREFFIQLLYHFPYVQQEPFQQKFKSFKWRHDEKDFKAWCEGKTGYTLVDAGMRELNATGFMHNRARLVTASFLTKHLLIDWKWGEAYFAQKLLDYEQASNNGNWQWSAGTGADAQPFFRIFNPDLQQEKFDPDYTYVKKWVKEFGTSHYPPKMVDHKWAVERAKKAFGVISSR